MDTKDTISPKPSQGSKVTSSESDKKKALIVGMMGTAFNLGLTILLTLTDYFFFISESKLRFDIYLTLYITAVSAIGFVGWLSEIRGKQRGKALVLVSVALTTPLYLIIQLYIIGIIVPIVVLFGGSRETR